MGPAGSRRVFDIGSVQDGEFQYYRPKWVVKEWQDHYRVWKSETEDLQKKYPGKKFPYDWDDAERLKGDIKRTWNAIGRESHYQKKQQQQAKKQWETRDPRTGATVHHLSLGEETEGRPAIWFKETGTSVESQEWS